MRLEAIPAIVERIVTESRILSRPADLRQRMAFQSIILDGILKEFPRADASKRAEIAGIVGSAYASIIPNR